MRVDVERFSCIKFLQEFESMKSVIKIAMDVWWNNRRKESVCKERLITVYSLLNSLPHNIYISSGSMCVCVCVWISLYVCVRMCAWISLCVHVCVYVRVCTQVHIYIYIYIEVNKKINRRCKSCGLKKDSGLLWHAGLWHGSCGERLCWNLFENLSWTV